MALGTIATIATIAAAAASLASIGYSASQGAPKMPNGASASREIAQAQANALPTQRQIAAAEQQGGTVSVPVAKHRETQQFVQLPGETSVNSRGQPVKGRSTQLVPYVASEWQPGGKYYQEGAAPPHIITRKVKVAAGTKTADFAGYGTADIEGELAKKMADIQLQLGKKYGTQFADEARKEAELADPEGTAARAKEYQMIEEQIKNPPPINPLAPALERSINEQVKAGSGLDPMSRDLLDAAITRANAARGGSTQAGDVATSMSTGNEGNARREAAITKGQQFLSSGSTPEDIQYRREQQNLTNLGAFVGGRTPESQFQDLSGASSGATPFYPGQPGPSQPNNAGALGPAYSVAAYQQQLRNAGQGANWLSGLSAALGGTGATLTKING